VLKLPVAQELTAGSGGAALLEADVWAGEDVVNAAHSLGPLLQVPQAQNGRED
jgi:hypothetical protein